MSNPCQNQNLTYYNEPVGVRNNLFVYHLEVIQRIQNQAKLLSNTASAS